MEREIRPVDPDEFPDFISVTHAAFGGHPTAEELEDDAVVGDFDRSLGVVEDGRFVGAAGAFAFDLTLPGGATEPVSGVTWVGVLPTHRRQGILRSLMRRQLDDIAARGESIAILTASEATIYGRFGYGNATRYAMVEVDPKRTEMLVPPAAGRIRLVNADEARKLLPAAYDAYRRTRPGELGRHDRWWDYSFKDRERWRNGASATFYAVHESTAGEVDGYARYRVKETWTDAIPGNRLIANDVVAQTVDAEAALWRYLFDLDLLHSAELRVRPLDDWLPLRLLDSRSYRQTGAADFLWVRLVDVGTALQSRRYAVDGAITFAVDDPFRPANSGQWILEGGPAGAFCRRGDESVEADIALDVRHLGAAYLGGVPFRALVAAGVAEERRPGAAARADAMFAVHPLPFCRTGF